MSNTPLTGNSHGNPSTPVPADVEGLLRTITREPGRPRLTWYGDDGERVELSGAVLENWVNKVTNLLVEEFDAGPGTRVALDLPVHWRTIVWALGAWRTGATAILFNTDRTHGADNVKSHGTVIADVVVTADPTAWTDGAADVVAVALPALARAFDGDLPAGALDAASAVMTYGDQVAWVPPVDPAVPAVEQPGGHVAHVDLVTRAAGSVGAGPGARVVVEGSAPVHEALPAVLGVLALDGSVVLLSEGRTAELAADEAARRRLVQSEHVDTGV